jgi:hypothetical protein
LDITALKTSPWNSNKSRLYASNASKGTNQLNRGTAVNLNRNKMKGKHRYFHSKEAGFPEMVFVERPTKFGHEIICRLYRNDFASTTEMLEASKTITDALNNLAK